MSNEINFDMERMEKAISGESILIPSSLTREEMRWYICATARKEIEIPDEIKHDDVLLGEYVKLYYSLVKEIEDRLSGTQMSKNQKHFLQVGASEGEDLEPVGALTCVKWCTINVEDEFDDR